MHPGCESVFHCDQLGQIHQAIHFSVSRRRENCSLRQIVWTSRASISNTCPVNRDCPFQMTNGALFAPHGFASPVSRYVRVRNVGRRWDAKREPRVIEHMTPTVLAIRGEVSTGRVDAARSPPATCLYSPDRNGPHAANLAAWGRVYTTLYTTCDFPWLWQAGRRA